MSSKENRLFSVLLSVTNALSGLVLLMFSAWFIAACAVASAGFNYMLPAVVIRALALTKIASGYGYMWFGHKVVLCAMSQLRQGIFARLMTGIPDNKTQQMESVAKHSEELAGIWIKVICHGAGVVATLLLCHGFMLWQLPGASFYFLLMLLVFVAVNIALVVWGLRISHKALASRNCFVFDLESELTNAGLWHLRDDFCQDDFCCDDFSKKGLFLPDASGYWQHMGQLNSLIKYGVVVFHGVNLLLLIGLTHSGVLTGQGPVLLVPLLLLLTAKDWLAPGFGTSSAWLSSLQAQHHIDSLKSQPVIKADSAATDMLNVMPLKGFSITNFAAKGRIMPAVTGDFGQGGNHLIKGSSGCGKSSLLQALSGLLPAQGILTVSTKDSAVLPMNILPHSVLVEQNIGCLSDTLKANLSIAKNTSGDQELNQVMASLGLADIPLDSWVGDKGRRLSGGELKRLGLARAILSDKATWLLDEPFEGLDTDNINRVVAILNSYAENHTIIIASHIVPELLEVEQTIDMDRIGVETFDKKTFDIDRSHGGRQDCLDSGENRAA